MFFGGKRLCSCVEDTKCDFDLVIENLSIFLIAPLVSLWLVILGVIL